MGVTYVNLRRPEPLLGEQDRTGVLALFYSDPNQRREQRTRCAVAFAWRGCAMDGVWL
jgi:hypothetical protein